MGYDGLSTSALAMHIGRPITVFRFLLLTTLVVGAMGNARAQDASGVPKPATTVVAAAVATQVEGDRTQFRVTLSEPVEASAHLMEGPDRVIVDLPEVAFHLAAENGKKRDGLIASYRYGLFAPGRSRVVIDLAEPAVVANIRAERDASGSASTPGGGAETGRARRVPSGSGGKRGDHGPYGVALAARNGGDER